MSRRAHSWKILVPAVAYRNGSLTAERRARRVRNPLGPAYGGAPSPEPDHRAGPPARGWPTAGRGDAPPWRFGCMKLRLLKDIDHSGAPPHAVRHRSEAAEAPWPSRWARGASTRARRGQRRSRPKASGRAGDENRANCLKNSRVSPPAADARTSREPARATSLPRATSRRAPGASAPPRRACPSSASRRLSP